MRSDLLELLIDTHCQRLSLKACHCGGFLVDPYFQSATPEAQLECIRGPCRWKHRFEMRHTVQHTKPAKALHHTHPSARHGGDVQPLVGFGIVIVKVQP